MDPALLRELLILGVGLLVLALLGCILALRLQNRQDRAKRRIGSVAGSHTVATAPVVEYRTNARLPRAPKPLLHQAGMLIGYDARRSSHYPVKWWIVAVVSLVAARLFVQLLVPLVGSIAIVSFPFLAVLIARTVHRWFIERRKTLLYNQFPDALAMIVRGVRVGIPVTESLRVVARESMLPTTTEFQLVADRVTLGAPLDKTLYEMADRNDIAEYRFFATAIGLQSQMGGALSETLDNLADVIRKRVALRARGRALASEARTSIIILCSLPVVAGVAISFLNFAYIQYLFVTDTGRQIMGIAVVSFCIGLGIMQWIVKKNLS